MTVTPVGQFIYQIYVNGVLYKDTVPLDVQLRQEWGRHDIFSMRIEYPRTYANPNSIQFWAEDSPVKIIWGRKPDNVSTWYGYVNHYEPATPSDSGTNTFQLTYYLIGTSKPMNSDVNKSWGSVTPTFIAKTIAAKYGLRAVLTSTDWVLPHETQAGESDFCFMNRLAEKTGFRFWVSGGTLYFIDPAVVLLSSHNTSAIPIFRQDKTFWQHDTMRRFHSRRGDNIPGSVIANRTLFGVTEDNQVINPVVNSGSSVTHQKTSRFVTTETEGRNIVSAWQSLSQFWISADAEFYGNVLVYPGKLVNIQGNWLPGNNQGYWIVSSATHKLKSAYSTRTSDDWYITQVTMLRNASGTANIKGTPVIKPEFMDCSLFGNRWRANTTSVIYDGIVK